jgi:hypothetical protein
VPTTATTLGPLPLWPLVDAMTETLDKAASARHTPEGHIEHVIVTSEVLKPAFDSGCVCANRNRVP